MLNTLHIRCDYDKRIRSKQIYSEEQLSAVSDQVFYKIMDKDTAVEAWRALEGQFEASSKDRLLDFSHIMYLGFYRCFFLHRYVKDLGVIDKQWTSSQKRESAAGTFTSM